MQIPPESLCIYIHGCATGSFTFREERRLSVFENENRVLLRKILGPEREGVTWEWRRLHSEEPQHLYPSPSIVQVIISGRKGWLGHIVNMR